MKALGIAERHGLPRFVSQQIYYSLQARDAEYELVPLGRRPGPRHAGLEPARRRPAVRQVPARAERARPARGTLTDWDEPPVYDEDKLYDTVEVLVEIGDEHGVSAAQVALAYLLGRPAVTSLVIGARTDEQLADNLAAADLALDRRGASRGSTR